MRAYCHRLLALAAVFLVILFTATATRADPYEDALAHFLADNFNSTIEGINGVASSGHPLAEKVVGALQSGRLLFSAEQKRLSRMLDSMAGLVTGTRDALTRFTQPLTGSYYFVPSVESLRRLR